MVSLLIVLTKAPLKLLSVNQSKVDQMIVIGGSVIYPRCQTKLLCAREESFFCISMTVWSVQR